MEPESDNNGETSLPAPLSNLGTSSIAKQTQQPPTSINGVVNIDPLVISLDNDDGDANAKISDTPLRSNLVQPNKTQSTRDRQTLPKKNKAKEKALALQQEMVDNGVLESNLSFEQARLLRAHRSKDSAPNKSVIKETPAIKLARNAQDNDERGPDDDERVPESVSESQEPIPKAPPRSPRSLRNVVLDDVDEAPRPPANVARLNSADNKRRKRGVVDSAGGKYATRTTVDIHGFVDVSEIEKARKLKQKRARLELLKSDDVERDHEVALELQRQQSMRKTRSVTEAQHKHDDDDANNKRQRSDVIVIEDDDDNVVAESLSDDHAPGAPPSIEQSKPIEPPKPVEISKPQESKQSESKQSESKQDQSSGKRHTLSEILDADPPPPPPVDEVLATQVEEVRSSQDDDKIVLPSYEMSDSLVCVENDAVVHQDLAVIPKSQVSSKIHTGVDDMHIDLQQVAVLVSQVNPVGRNECVKCVHVDRHGDRRDDVFSNVVFVMDMEVSSIRVMCEMNINQHDGHVARNVLEAVDSVMNTAAKRAILLCDSTVPKRTLTRLTAIACHVPCVRFEWAMSCVMIHKLIPVSSEFLIEGGICASELHYTLPAYVNSVVPCGVATVLRRFEDKTFAPPRPCRLFSGYRYSLNTDDVGGYWSMLCEVLGMSRDHGTLITIDLRSDAVSTVSTISCEDLIQCLLHDDVSYRSVHSSECMVTSSNVDTGNRDWKQLT